MSETDGSVENADPGETPDPVVEPTAPFLRIVRGDASPEEIAALVTVLASLGGGEAPAPRPRSEWAAPYRQARAPIASGRGAWRASGLPR